MTLAFEVDFCNAAFTRLTGNFIALVTSENVGRSKEQPTAVLIALLCPGAEASLGTMAAVFTGFDNFEVRVS